MHLPTVGLLSIHNRKLLLAFSNNKQCFYLPGGKVDANETPLEALIREIEEELNVLLDVKDLQYYTHITAPAYGEKNNIIMEQDCYLVTEQINPFPSAEISALKYFTRTEYELEQNQAPGARIILQQLKEDKLID